MTLHLPHSRFWPATSISLVLALVLGCTPAALLRSQDTARLSPELTPDIYSSDEWLEFLRTASLTQPPSLDRRNLESACAQAIAQSLDTAHTLEAKYQVCLDAAAKAISPNGWYRSRAKVQADLRLRPERPAEVRRLSPSIIVMTVTTFVLDTRSQLVIGLRSQQEAGLLDSIILDLRGNDGGSISGVDETSSLFVSAGTALGEARTFENFTLLARNPIKLLTPPTAKELSFLRNAKLAILVNGDTAGGAELLAQGLRLQRGATLLGSRTNGDAATDYVKVLARPDYAIRFRNGTLYDVRGVTWQSVGIQPDIVIPQTTKLYRSGQDNADDPVLNAAKSLLEARAR